MLSDDLIIRIYEVSGEGGEGEILFGFDIEEAHEVDLLERKLAVLKTKETG